ncbi:MAG: hypothetical protein Gaeavirus24_1, partial [Gaeavirus sp.]
MELGAISQWIFNNVISIIYVYMIVEISIDKFVGLQPWDILTTYERRLIKGAKFMAAFMLSKMLLFHVEVNTL